MKTKAVNVDELQRVTREQMNSHDVSYYVGIGDILDYPDVPDCGKCKEAVKSSITNQIHISLTLSNSFASETIDLIMENVDISVSKIIDNIPLKEQSNEDTD